MSGFVFVYFIKYIFKNDVWFCVWKLIFLFAISDDTSLVDNSGLMCLKPDHEPEIHVEQELKSVSSIKTFVQSHKFMVDKRQRQLVEVTLLISTFMYIFYCFDFFYKTKW